MKGNSGEPCAYFACQTWVNRCRLCRYERWQWPWKLALDELDGEAAVIILQRGAGTRMPHSAIRFDVVGQQIERIVDYIDCPWLLAAATNLTVVKV